MLPMLGLMLPTLPMLLKLPMPLVPPIPPALPTLQDAAPQPAPSARCPIN